MPSESDLEAWCFHCMAQAELPDLIATTRAIEKAYAELRRLHRAGTARYQRDLLNRTAKGRRFRVFTVNLVPGAFQTPASASTVLTDAAEMLGHPAGVESTVAARMERARIVQTGGRFYHAVMLENVLNAGIVPTDVMIAPLHRMLELRQAPGLHLGIIPAGRRRYMPMCEFNIIDDTAVEVETFSAIIRVTQPREIAVYAKVFDHYAREAVYGNSARYDTPLTIHREEPSKLTSRACGVGPVPGLHRRASRSGPKSPRPVAYRAQRRTAVRAARGARLRCR